MLAGLTPSAAGAHLRVFGALLGFGLAALTLGPLLDPKTFPATLHLAAVAAVALLLVGGTGDRQSRAPPAVDRLSGAGGGDLRVDRDRAQPVRRQPRVGDLGRRAALPLRHRRAARCRYGGGRLGAGAARWPAAARVGRLAFAAAALVVVWMALIGPWAPIDAHESDRRETAQRAGRDPRRHLRGAAGRHGGDSQPAVRLGRVAQRTTTATASRDRRRVRDLLSGDIVDGRRVVFTTDDGLVLQGARRGPTQRDAGARVARAAGSR